MFSAQKRLESLREHFRTHNKIKELRPHNSKVHTVRWSCDGRKLASGSNDKTVCRENVEVYKILIFVAFRSSCFLSIGIESRKTKHSMDTQEPLINWPGIRRIQISWPLPLGIKPSESGIPEHIRPLARSTPKARISISRGRVMDPRLPSVIKKILSRLLTRRRIRSEQNTSSTSRSMKLCFQKPATPCTSLQDKAAFTFSVIQISRCSKCSKLIQPLASASTLTAPECTSQLALLMHWHRSGTSRSWLVCECSRDSTGPWERFLSATIANFSHQRPRTIS